MPADPERVAETSESRAESADNSTATSRRRFLSAAAVGSATAVAGCADLLGSDGLRVMVWSGNYADRFEDGLVSQWEEEYDTEIDVRRGWDEILSRMQEAPADDPPFDVTVAEGEHYYIGRQDDLFEPIRRENISNEDEIMDFFMEIRTPEYGMPVDGAPCTIIHREDADVEPESWGDLASDAVADSRGIGIDTGFWWYPLYAAAIGMGEAEGVEEVYDDDLQDDVLETIEEEWDVTSWAESGEDIWQAFDDGVIDVAQWYYDQTAFDIDDYEGLTHTMPEQTTGWINNWCVVKGTDKRDEAEEFIDFLLDGDVQSEWAESHPMMFSNENIDYPEELAADLPTTNEEAEEIEFPDWDRLAEHRDYLSDEFTDMRQDA